MFLQTVQRPIFRLQLLRQANIITGTLTAPHHTPRPRTTVRGTTPDTSRVTCLIFGYRYLPWRHANSLQINIPVGGWKSWFCMRPTFAPKRTTPPRGNIAAVYFAITRKYGYTRLESELAHSINVYCRALQRAPSTTPCSNERAPISWDFPDVWSNVQFGAI